MIPDLAHVGSHDLVPPTHTLSVIRNTHQHIPQFPPDSAFLVLLLAELLIRSPQSLCPGNPFGRAKYFQAAGKEGREEGREEGRILS